ncbi:pyruvate dehydrogenase (acetyl-transferring) E1 component subunit alpha [Pseudonocardia ailaonensis]|uniref:Pyruvate dehydrogenase (Acetyl-transferring) E1 component subunit alpha n=1 Tax=Pseudonocardia ailaonensis TaxID=367279 RepID=A0ABN2N3I6_9PSEU
MSELGLYRTMLVSRALDDECMDMLARGLPVPHFHSGAGQEALSVGGAAGLRDSDVVIYSHRGYAQLLAKGVPLEVIARDMFYKAGGSNAARGGVMHVSAPEIGVPGREGVFGARFGMAAGFGLAQRLRDTDDVTVCFYGEAAGARGPLYEALNMAVLWDLPVVLIAENNGWSVNSRTEWLYPNARMSAVWRGFDIPVTVVDGNDLGEVRAAVGEAVRRARAGEGPSVVEGLTYRLHPHIWWDDAAYVPAEELAEAQERDPLTLTRAALVAAGTAPEQLDALEAEVAEEVRAVLAEVLAGPDAQWDVEPRIVGVAGV